MRYISIFLSATALFGCATTTAPTQVATAVNAEQPTQAVLSTETIAPPASPDSKGTQPDNSDLCEWFVKTQFLRSERISELDELGKIFQQENPDPKEFLQAIKDYRPHQDKFLEEWLKLGSHPEAKEFWEKELSSVQISANAFDAMIDGLENNDRDKFDQGVSLFQDAQESGNEAETAMLKVREKCIGQ